jgi:putative ABC transport system permease protein
MLRLTLRNIARRKLRYALTTLAVVLGVAFLSTSFFLTDKIRDTFDELATDITGDLDLVVRTSIGEGERLNRLPIPEELESVVASVPGVAEVDPRIVMWNVIPIIPADGVEKAKAVPSRGAPQFGMIYSEVPGLSQLFLIEGRAPERVGSLDDPGLVGEFVMDARTAEDHRFAIGETYRISSPTGLRDFVLVGIFNFGDPDENKTVGANMSAFDRLTAQEFLDMEGLFDELEVTIEPGTDRDTVQAAIQAELDAVKDTFLVDLSEMPEEFQALLAPYLEAELEVITSDQQIEESKTDFDLFITVISSVLLAFAIIAVVVSTFIINNTFSIVLGQRVRELALLRALGATGRQVSQSIRFEGFVIGTVATFFGLIGGYLLAMLLRLVLVSTGFGELPGSIPIRPRTLIVAALVGIGTTVASTIGPSRRVRSIPPVAALRDDVRLTPTGLRRRLQAGGLVALVGIALLAAGMTIDLETRPLLFSLGLGALGTFLGVYLLSPVIARPVADLLGRPIQRIYRVPGRLARDNARRSPRRTAATAAALTVGLALVSMAAVVSDSMKATFVQALEDGIEADLFVYTVSFSPTGGLPDELSEGLVDLADTRPDLVASTAIYRVALGGMTIDGDPKDVGGVDLDLINDHMNLSVVEGDPANPPTGGAAFSLLLHIDPAADLGVGVGSLVDIGFPGGHEESFSVGAVFDDSTMMGNWVIDNDAFDRFLPRAPDNSMSIAYAADADPVAARTLVETVTDDYPQASVNNGNELREEMEGQLDQLLSIITVFLGLSLFIAVLGITNTLALSVYERTRELGLLRAVGMTRRQMRRMVRWEAVIIALFGGILGVAMGVLFGLAATAAIPETFIDVVSVPVQKLVLYLVVAGLFGVVAAIFPARRASRLDILEAISYE